MPLWDSPGVHRERRCRGAARVYCLSIKPCIGLLLSCINSLMPIDYVNKHTEVVELSHTLLSPFSTQPMCMCVCVFQCSNKLVCLHHITVDANDHTGVRGRRTKRLETIKAKGEEAYLMGAKKRANKRWTRVRKRTTNWKLMWHTL